MNPSIDPWLARWELTPDGEAFRTPFLSWIAPVRWRGRAAILKVAQNQEEREGAALMRWYGGEGAVEVFAHEDPAILLERAEGPRTLRAMAQSGNDAEACAIIADTLKRLHRPRPDRPSFLAPLPVWCRQLGPAAARVGGVLVKSHAAAQELLSDPRELVVLHGDIHHDNILDGGARGWLAIDPKGLFGERGFDFANSFCNPDIETAARPGRLAACAAHFSAATGIEARRLLMWALAYSGLSASWSLDEGADPTLALAVAEIAAQELHA